jgi:chromosome segregation ATPase
VVVFQTIEIERLSLEIESLRVVLKDSQRQVSNYLNYEVQIKELTENCHQLEEQRVNYQNQAEKMSLACNSLYEQMSDAKRQHERELDDARRELARNREDWERNAQGLGEQVRKLEAELQRKADAERDSQNRTKVISQELVRLNQVMYDTQEDIFKLRDKAAKTQAELSVCQGELSVCQGELSNCQSEMGKWQQ